MPSPSLLFPPDQMRVLFCNRYFQSYTSGGRWFFLTGKFNPKYDASLWVLPEAPITFSTNHGPIRFQVRDVSGIVTERQTYGEFYMESHCAFIFFDVTSGVTCEHALGWHRALMGVRQAANLDPRPTVLTKWTARIRG